MSIVLRGVWYIYVGIRPNNAIFSTSGGSSNPSFMPDDFAISSASCGDEQIDIKSSFKRPINIAVYGHPFYEVCKTKYNKMICLILLPQKKANDIKPCN